jgi:AAA domain
VARGTILHPGERPTSSKRKIVATYSYLDATGSLAFQVVRFDPKDFRQRRPTGNGGWIWDMHGVQRIPYRLPELLQAAPFATVLICEGEKDCDALHERGLIATTNPGGAGKWLLNMSEHFRNRHVAILPDNDVTGAKHADEVARSLQGKATSVRILRLPGLPPKGDVSDWLEAGGSAEELERLAAESSEEPSPAGDNLPGLRDHLAIEAWAVRPMPPPDRLLGDLLTTTSRMFLVGRTGLGKTMLGFAIACGIASGEGFLHLRASRPARVLYIDGEMPGELIKSRSIDALRRTGMAPLPGNLLIYSRDTEDDFAKRFPTLGMMPPLNAEAGHNFVLALIAALGGVDVVIFDNVMSLIPGDHREEIPWNETLPLVGKLTARRIGQLWLDHTGHNAERQYGSSTKAWRFDAVGVMTPLPDVQRGRHEVAFTLSFEHPGKARRRTLDNWADFATCIIRLKDDRWTSEPADPSAVTRKLSPTGRMFYRALLDALAISAIPGRTTRTLWFAEAARTGLAEPLAPDDDSKARSVKQTKFRKYLAEIRLAGLIGVDGDTITDLRTTGEQA